MLRRTCLVITLLLLGAIVNVTVAWACALWSTQDRWTRTEALPPPESWPHYLEQCHWPAPYQLQRRIGVGIGVRVFQIDGGDRTASWNKGDEGKTYVSLEVRQFGLPLRALQSESHGVIAGARSSEMVRAAAAAAGWRNGIETPRFPDRKSNGATRYLPVNALWPGFVVNTLFYAAILFLFFAAPFTLRRRLRLRHHRCPHCNYPFGESPACTECGRDLSRWMVPDGA